MKKIGNQTTARLMDILQFQVTFLICLIVMWLCVTFIFYPVRVDGLSMYPTLHDNDFGFSSILRLNTQQLKRFDTVIVEADNHEFWVKRVIGLPNETIECKNNQIYINGLSIDETYLDEAYVQQEIEEHGFFTHDFEKRTIGSDEVFLLGDNRVHSLDSRVKGPFKIDELRAKGLMILYPFEHGKVID